MKCIKVIKKNLFLFRIIWNRLIRGKCDITHPRWQMVTHENLYPCSIFGVCLQLYCLNGKNNWIINCLLPWAHYALKGTRKVIIKRLLHVLFMATFNSFTSQSHSPSLCICLYNPSFFFFFVHRDCLYLSYPSLLGKRLIFNINYCISQLVRALWLVNLAGRILLYGPLKFKSTFVAKMFRDLPPSLLNIFSK